MILLWAKHHTGIPSFLALSSRFSWVAVPGNTITPIGRTSSIASLRLNGAPFGVPGPIRLESDLRHLAVVGPAGGDAFGALRRAAVQQHHVGVLGMNPVEPVPDQAAVVEVEAAGDGDLWAGRHQHLVLGPALAGVKIAAVDHGQGQSAVVDHRPRAGAPGRAGVALELVGGLVAKEF